MTFPVCVVGCGRASTSRHGPSLAKYAAAHPDVRLAACCDLDDEAAAVYQAQFGFVKRYTDLDRMLAEERPAAVYVIMPTSLTCEVACRVLEAGFPVLTEKPPGETVAETDRLVEASARAGQHAMAAFNRRYTPLVERLRASMDEHLAQPAQRIRCTVARVRRADRDFSLTAVHGLDLLRFLGGDLVSAEFRYEAVPDYPPEVVNMRMFGTFANGCVCEAAFNPVTGTPVERIEVYGLDHSWLLDYPLGSGVEPDGRLRHWERGEARLDLTSQDLGLGEDAIAISGSYAETAAFLDALREGAAPPGSVAESRQSVALMECLRTRAATYTQ
jgi:predicted dehydrogenase